MTIRNYRDLLAWQKAMDLVEAVYRDTELFPAHEKFGLCQQLRRAAVSVPSNIAEGEGRSSRRDFANLLSIAHGSLREIETQVLIARRLNYFSDDAMQTLMDQCAEVGRVVAGLARTVRENE
jgi:four helix bundle protein